MATFVQKQEKSTGASASSITMSLGTVTTGNIVIAVVNWGNSSGAGSGNVTAVNDNQGDTWHKLGPTKYTPATGFGGLGGEVWYKIATTSASTSVTFTLNTFFTFQRLASCEYSGISSPFADPNASNPVTNTGTGTSLTSGTLTTDDTDVLIELAFSNSGNTMASSGSFTQRVAGSNGS